MFKEKMAVAQPPAGHGPFRRRRREKPAGQPKPTGERNGSGSGGKNLTPLRQLAFRDKPTLERGEYGAAIWQNYDAGMAIS